MSVVKIKDKTFRTFITESEILEKVKSVANKLNHDMDGKNPIFLAVLNGSFIFAADLIRNITIPCEISFVKLASYEGDTTTGKVKKVIGLNTDIKDRDVVIVEDIVDTGTTMKNMLAELEVQKPKSVHICTLLVKPDKLKEAINIEYPAMKIPNDFIVGYGLDYDQQGRNLKDIYVVDDNTQQD